MNSAPLGVTCHVVCTVRHIVIHSTVITSRNSLVRVVLHEVVDDSGCLLHASEHVVYEQLDLPHLQHVPAVEGPRSPLHHIDGQSVDPTRGINIPYS